MKKQLAVLFLSILCLPLLAQTWQSNLLKMDNEGNLTYYPDDNGFIIPNFSHAGYKGGDAELPTVEVKKTISPIAGDNTAHIQAAIDEVAQLLPNANGHKGAVLLSAGKYEIRGTINVNSSGVVLRGVGDGEDENSNTILYATENTPTKRDVILIGNASINGPNYWFYGQSASVNITTPKIKVGDYSFDVATAANYQVGDRVIIFHPVSQAWLDAIDGGGISRELVNGVEQPGPNAPWPLTKPAGTGLPNHIMYNRTIRAIEGNTITVDAPFFYTLDKNLTQCSMHKYSALSDFVSEVGVENLRIDIATNGSPTDNEHAPYGFHSKGVDDGWITGCTVLHHSLSAFRTEATNRFTIENCKALDPVGTNAGGYRYGFNTYSASQLVLFKDCYSRGSRHDFISDGISTTSGCVVLRCVAEASIETSEAHRYWTCGMLFDCFEVKNTSRYLVIGLGNRGNFGDDHGWSAAHCFLWNSKVPDGKAILLQKPPTAQNYAIGFKGGEIRDNWCFKPEPLGYIEGFNAAGTLEPASLYEAQWNERHKETLTTQTIELVQGWNLISCYVEPADKAVEKVFENVLPDVEIIKDFDGFYKPGMQKELQSLTEIRTGYGYLVKMKSPATLSVTGKTANNISIPLKQGWNLIGYPYAQPQATTDVLAPIWTETETIKNFDGFLDKTSGDLNSMQAGKGYYIFINSDLEFIY